MTKAITAMLVYLTKEVNYYYNFPFFGGGGGELNQCGGYRIKCIRSMGHLKLHDTI